MQEIRSGNQLITKTSVLPKLFLRINQPKLVSKLTMLILLPKVLCRLPMYVAIYEHMWIMLN